MAEIETYFNGTGFISVGLFQAPLPVLSHTERRTHFLPVASKGILKSFVPKAVVSVRSMIWRLTFDPSLQTNSAKSSGNVYSILAV